MALVKQMECEGWCPCSVRNDRLDVSRTAAAMPFAGPNAVVSKSLLQRWKPAPNGPELVVVQGDLTESTADAIVNPANSHLFHGGGVAGAIVRKGGRAIEDESRQWIQANDKLAVGHAMSTTAGRLPSRYVIHTVGPHIRGVRHGSPTYEEAQQLRDAVWSALSEAERLGLSSIAMPGISSGIFGYPRDLAAKEIVGECVNHCRLAHEKGKGATSLETILLMNNDNPTYQSFIIALNEAAAAALGEKLETIEDEMKTPKNMQEEPVVSESIGEATPFLANIPARSWRNVVHLVVSWPWGAMMLATLLCVVAYIFAIHGVGQDYGGWCDAFL